MALEVCPNCSYRLGAPLKSSGRQVCMKCGWSDRPRQSNAKVAPVDKPTRNLTPEEIQKILGEAAAISKNNMKPRSKQDPGLQPKPNPAQEQ